MGNNFIVPTQEGNHEGVEFYIVWCQQVSYHIVQDKLTCAWGGEFDYKDHITFRFIVKTRLKFQQDLSYYIFA